MSILEELWYGNINPCEDRDISNEEKKLLELMARHQEYLTSKLKGEELDSFQKYIECNDEYTSLIECRAFEIGFKIAVELLVK